MDAGDHVNTQLLIIIVIGGKLSDYSNVILKSNYIINNNKVKYTSRP